MKKQHTYLPETQAAAAALGAQIGAARRELGWTAVDLAGRLGISAGLVARIEKGSTEAAIGTVFEAAAVCGVPLFGVEPADLPAVAERTRDRLALLPQRVRRARPQIDNDF